MYQISEISEFLVAMSTSTELTIKVTPKASSNRLGEIFKMEDGKSVLKIYITQVPEQGKANEAVIDLLAKCWRLPKSILSIKQGTKSRYKILSIAMPKETLMTHLKEHHCLEKCK